MPPVPMSGAELQSIREYLGLTGDRLADVLDVAPRTVRYWEAGQYPIPDGVRDEVAQLVAHTDRAVTRLTRKLLLTDDPARLIVTTYRTDAQLTAAEPVHARLGARWWRHVVARAVLDPDLRAVDAHPRIVTE